MIVALAVGTLSAGISSVRASEEAVTQKRLLLGRLHAIIERLPAELEHTRQSNLAASEEFLSGDSETVIRASLQQKFTQVASSQSLAVVSVGNAPDIIRQQVTYAGLQDNVTGSIAALQKTLLALESTKPVLFVTKLTVRSTDQLALQKPVAEPVLVAQLRLYGALKPQLASPQGKSE